MGGYSSQWHRGSRPHGHCKPLYIRGLLHLAILKLLRNQPLHGAEIQRIVREKYGIDVAPPVVYGLLRRLEAHGFVVSTWETGSSGPAKRVYRITEEGSEYLSRAMEKLEVIRSIVDRLLSE